MRGRFAKQTSQNTDNNNSQISVKSKKRSVTFGSDSEVSSDEDDTIPTYRDSDDEEGVTYAAGQDEPANALTVTKPVVSTYLDGDFLEFTGGRPLPLTDRARAAFHMSILNVSIAFMVEYSINLHPR